MIYIFYLSVFHRRDQVLEKNAPKVTLFSSLKFNVQNYWRETQNYDLHYERSTSIIFDSFSLLGIEIS